MTSNDANHGDMMKAKALAAAIARATSAPAQSPPAPTPTDLPLPGDWSNQRLLGLALGAHALMLLLALRHRFVWGGAFAPVLHGLEALGLIAFTMLAGISFHRAVRQASSLDLGFVQAGGAALAALAALAPPFLSSDVFDYVARGYVAVLGHNPYITTVDSVLQEPGMAPFAALAQWPKHVMPYGPISAVLQWFTALCSSPWLAVYAWKLLCVLAHIATASILLRTLRLLGSERDARRGYVLWLWNPWILLECCGSAHNEAFVALGLAATGLALARGNFFGTALSYGAMILVKHGSAPLSLLLLVTSIWQKRRVAFLAGAATTLVAALLCALWLWSEPTGLDWIANQRNVARGSLGSLLGPVVGSATAMIGLVLLLLINLAGVKHCKDATAFGRYGVLGMTVFVLFLVPNFAPWYQLWWLPLFALTQLPLLTRVLELLAWTGPFSYLVVAATHGFGTVHEVWALLLTGIWPALLILLDWRNLTGIQRKLTVADQPASESHAH